MARQVERKKNKEEGSSFNRKSFFKALLFAAIGYTLLAGVLLWWLFSE